MSFGVREIDIVKWDEHVTEWIVKCNRRIRFSWVLGRKAIRCWSSYGMWDTNLTQSLATLSSVMKLSPYSSVSSTHPPPPQSIKHQSNIRFHRLNPEYIHGRIQELKKESWRLKVLLCLVDLENSRKDLPEITNIAALNGFTLICAWTPKVCVQLQSTQIARFRNVLDTWKRSKRMSNDQPRALKSTSRQITNRVWLRFWRPFKAWTKRTLRH